MDYQKLMEQRNRNNPFAKLLAITITEISEGHATAELSVREDHFNPQNSVHGGCLFSLADAACGSAGASYGWNITTIDSDFHFLRAGLTSTRLIAEATCIKPGKSIMVFARVQGNVFYLSVGCCHDDDFLVDRGSAL